MNAELAALKCRQGMGCPGERQAETFFAANGLTDSPFVVKFKPLRLHPRAYLLF
jgi:hypothetical protein